MIQRFLRCLLSALIPFLVPSVVNADNTVVVIVHESNKENIDVDKLKFIYSDHIAVWQNGQKIEVYNLPVKSELREKFSREILGITAREAKSNEHNRVITNTLKNPHYEKQERMLLFRIAKNPNAIGYVGKDSIKGKSGIRIIHTIK